jgi:hypothetical protein
LAGILVVVFVDAVDSKVGWNRFLSTSPAALRWSVYYAFVISIIWIGSWGVQEFIYFKF